MELPGLAHLKALKSKKSKMMVFAMVRQISYISSTSHARVIVFGLFAGYFVTANHIFILKTVLYQKDF